MFSLETDSERIPRSCCGLASEYDKELFLSLRYPAVLPQGSSLNLKTNLGVFNSVLVLK